MKRRSLTAVEKLAMLKAQDWLCAICEAPLGTGRIEFDHSIPVAMGNGLKPDQVCCQTCHMLKTKDDVKRIAKAKRLHRTFVEGIKRAKRPIHSRGFDKAWSRRLDGTVVRRFA